MHAALALGGYVLLVVGLMVWGRYAQLNNPLMDDDGNLIEPYKTKKSDARTN